jgi:hypothetical protein
MADTNAWIALARVLVALGQTAAAEDIVVTKLDEAPDELTLLSLLAKIKHLRGELGQAIALWAAIHSRSRHADVALAQLTALRRLAEDPERAAGEFIALADGSLVKKHVAQIELERAFRLLRDGRVSEAEAVCDVVARRHGRRDRDVYKLAVLARAWVRELTGNLAGARAALEALGKERGFETDTDRLLFLVRVCEKLGGPDDVKAAIKVWQYLEKNFEKVSVLAHLSRLHRLVRDHASAAEYGRAYLVAFRRRMHRPTFAEVVQAATMRYLPIAGLRALQTVEGEPEPPPRGPLAEGVAEALKGDAERAARILRDAGSLGIAYMGDLDLAKGSVAKATELWATAIEANEGDIDVGLIAQLCDHDSGEMLRRLCQRGPWLDVALAAMIEAARREPREPAPWRRLASLEEAAGLLSEAERHAAKAAALEQAGPERRRPGRVLAAAVYRFVGKAKGLIHELWADRLPVEHGRGGMLDATQLHGNLTQEFVDAVRSTFVTTRQYVMAKFPHLTRDIDDYRYLFKVTKEDEPSGGLSAGLPTAVAFASVFLSKPVPEDVALTGAVVTDAHDVVAVGNVGDI